MKEIKFRAKACRDGQPVYGTFPHLDQVRRFSDPSKDYCVVHDKDGFVRLIDPDSIHFGTGRKDRNGKDIYKGDILGGIVGHGVVVWIPEESRFGVNIGGELHKIYLHELSQDELEVIGNIHDNPELLEGSHEQAES